MTTENRLLKQHYPIHILLTFLHKKLASATALMLFTQSPPPHPRPAVEPKPGPVARPPVYLPLSARGWAARVCLGEGKHPRGGGGSCGNNWWADRTRCWPEDSAPTACVWADSSRRVRHGLQEMPPNRTAPPGLTARWVRIHGSGNEWKKTGTCMHDGMYSHWRNLNA